MSAMLGRAIHRLNRGVPILPRPTIAPFETLISLIGEIDPDLVGLALLDRDLRIVERDSHISCWLPDPGQRCTDCAVLFGMDEAILALIDGERSSLVIPSVELSSAGQPLSLDIAISWHAGREHFVIASYPDHRSPEGEWLLATERRQKRLAEERLQAIGLHFEIEQARYRHIVEAGTDLVLRFTQDRILTFANKAALGLAAAREHDVIGRPLVEIFGPQLNPDPWERLAAPDEKLLSFEQAVRTANGDTAWIWWHVSAVGGTGSGVEYQAIGRDITVLHKLRQETERANANAQAAAATQERLRIARELHDTLIQSTMAVLAQIRLAQALLRADPAALPAALASAEEATRSSIDQARGAVAEFRLPQDESLQAGIRRRFAELELRAGIAVALSLDQGVDRLPGDLAGPVLKILDEAIRNIERHAQARQVSVEVSVEESVEAKAAPSVHSDTRLAVIIRDDGRGFDLAGAPAGHFGIVGMQEHARLAGGSLAIESAAGKGTTVRLSLPLASVERGGDGGRRRRSS
ncbi:PAS domain S-box-containing protein [Rhizobiales bacterium GAS113]|nr:PAS domain S-box-containing protein [Rhizobiales bacterium GAS113]